MVILVKKAYLGSAFNLEGEVQAGGQKGKSQESFLIIVLG